MRPDRVRELRVENRTMPFFDQHPRARWTAPVLAAALVVSGVAMAQSSAGGQSDLPQRSAHDLLVDLQKARPTPLSGTVVQRMDLGLPELPAGALGGGGSTSGGGVNPVSLLSGSHTWRVWYADPTHARLALVDGTDEYDVVRHGSDIWQWSSADASVVHTSAPADGKASAEAASPTMPPDPSPGLPDLSNPDAVATWALSQLGPTTIVDSTKTDMVAGRAAYGLVLTPRASDSRIGSVHLSLDAKTSLPLAATVIPRGSTVPAVDVRYTSLTLARPASSVFGFTPPPGAKVTTVNGGDGSGPAAARASGTRPQVVGTGWSSVLVGELPASLAAPAGGAGSNPVTALRRLLPEVAGPWGSGRLLTTRLFTVVLTDDGRFAGGAVDPSVLYAALAR
jgi:outer membrane lipoprotein-sorting protein